MSLWLSTKVSSSGNVKTQSDSNFQKLHKKDFINHKALLTLYDECSIQQFDRLHRIFYFAYWLNSTLVIVLSTLSGLAQTPDVANTSANCSANTSANSLHMLNVISLLAGITAGLLTALDRIVSFMQVADACKDARAELAFYLASKEPMPKRNFDKIARIGLLCFKHPIKCNQTISAV